MNCKRVVKQVSYGVLAGVSIMVLSSCRTDKPAPSRPPQVVQTRPAPVVIDSSGGTVGYKTSYPSEVNVGQPYEYVIMLENNVSGSAVGDVVVTQELSEEFEFLGSSPKARLSRESNTAVWEIGDMPQNGTVEIRVKGKATSEGSIVNCTKIDFKKKVCEEVIAIAPKLKIDKSMPEVVYACQKIPVKLIVSNTGTGTVKDVRVSDTLPSGLSSEGGKSLAWNIPAIAQGESKQITYNVIPQQTGVFTNEAVAETSSLKASDSAKVRVVKPVLEISKSGPDKVYIGLAMKYNITVSNTGDAAAKQFVVQDAVPANVKVTNISNGGKLVGNNVVWELADLRAGGSVNLSLGFTAVDAGTVTNKATASAYCATAVADTATTEVVGIPAILLEVVDVNDPTAVGENETYIITATNQGSAPGTNITITCTIENSQSFVSASGVTRESVSGNTIRFAPLPSLGAKKRASWKVVVKAVSADDVRFTVKMTSDQLRRSVDETEATTQY